jgi:hypothetical protein
MPIPPHAIIIGMPMFIIAIIRWQHSMNISLEASSMGIISHFMPVDVIVQVILHIIIGIMPPPIMVMGIMPPIIGIMPLIIGIMPPIMGIFIGIVMAAVVIVGSVVSLRRFVTTGLQGADGLEQRKMSGALSFGLIDWRLRRQ